MKRSFSLNPVSPDIILNTQVFRKIEVPIFEVLLYLAGLGECKIPLFTKKEFSNIMADLV